MNRDREREKLRFYLVATLVAVIASGVYGYIRDGPSEAPAACRGDRPPAAW